MPPALQGKLLRVLQDQRGSPAWGETRAVKVDVRIIAADQSRTSTRKIESGELP